MIEEGKNPYTACGNANTKTSVVACLDVLGYRNLIASCSSKAELNHKLHLLHECIAKTYDYVRDKDIPDAIGCQRFWETRTYSDNISICYPVRDDQINCPDHAKCSDNTILAISHVLSLLGKFQLEMICVGELFIRGAIAIGEAFVDDNIIYGDALLEAHDTEQAIAIDPRIILAPSAAARVDSYLCSNRQGDDVDFLEDLSRDADGACFIDYLSILNVGGVASKTECLYTSLKTHKDIVTKNLINYSNRPNVLRKYNWVAEYHNRYCIDNNISDKGLHIDCAHMQKELTAPSFNNCD